MNDLPTNWTSYGSGYPAGAATRIDGLILTCTVRGADAACASVTAQWRAYAADKHLLTPYPDLGGEAWIGEPGISLLAAIACTDARWPFVPLPEVTEPVPSLIRVPTEYDRAGLVLRVQRYALFQGASSILVPPKTARIGEAWARSDGFGSVIVLGEAASVRTITVAGKVIPLPKSPPSIVRGIPQSPDEVALRATTPRLIRAGQTVRIELFGGPTPEIVTAWIELLGIEPFLMPQPKD